MEFTKVLGLGMLAAVLTVCLAAPSAMADHAIVLCKTNEEACKTANYAGEGFTATAEASFNFGEAGTVKCSSTMTRSEAGQFSVLSFTECGEGCSIKANSLPYASSLASPSAGNGNIWINSSGAGEPKIAATCGGLECVYGAVSLETTYTGGKPATVAVSKSMTLQTKNFFCSKTMVWSGSYKFTSPTFAVYMANRAIEGSVFCEVNEKLCPQKSIVNSFTSELQSTSSFKVTKLTGGTVSCASSFFMLVKFDPYGLGPWSFKPNDLSKCTHPTYTSCVLKPESYSYYGYLVPSSEGNGEVAIKAGEFGKEPGLRIECVAEGIPFACLYSTKEFSLEFVGGALATLQEIASMTRTEGSKAFCPTSVAVQAGYKVVAAEKGGTSLYLTQS